MKGLKIKEFYEDNKEKIEWVGQIALCTISIAGVAYGGYKIGRATMTFDIAKELRILYSVNPHLKEVLTETINKVNSQG